LRTRRALDRQRGGLVNRAGLRERFNRLDMTHTAPCEDIDMQKKCERHRAEGCDKAQSYHHHFERHPQPLPVPTPENEAA
jgi:hypothetical protein